MLSNKNNSDPSASAAENKADMKVPLRKIADRLEIALASLGNQESKTTGNREAGQDSGVHNNMSFVMQVQESILSKMPRGIIAVDMDGNLMMYNETAEKILKVPKENVLFHPFWKHFSDNLLGFSLRKALRDKKSPGRAAETLNYEEGEKKLLEIEAVFIDILETGLLVILLQDVTEKQIWDLLIRRKAQMDELGEMIATLTHQIRNPLGGIKGFASLLERDLSDRQDLKKMAAFIIDGVNSLDSILTMVINYTKPIATQFELVDMVQLVDHVIQELLKEKSHNDKIHMELTTDPDSIFAYVDPLSIRKCVHNLIRNSREAMFRKGRGKIGISLKKEEFYLSIEINDNGQGIPQAHIKKIFSPFFSTKLDGAGFGLPESHKIIQLHGGKIEVESVEGEGTKTTVKIPLFDQTKLKASEKLSLTGGK